MPSAGSLDAGLFTFDYDESGNMVKDSRKRLEISPNVLNLPMIARDTAGTMISTMTYTFLGDGTKVGARVWTRGQDMMSMGNAGMRYRGSFVYDVADTGEQTLQSIAVSTGRLIAVTGTNGSVTFRNDGHITDHLGNVAAVVKLLGGNEIFSPFPGHHLNLPVLTTGNIILEQNDYLPFGTRLSGSRTDQSNRYRLGGKEEQDIAGMDLGLLDFGARYYDSYVGRWNAIDPLAHKYFGMSPYNYCGNDPVNRFDPDGRWNVTVHLYEDRATNGYGYAVVTDNEGNEVFRFDVRAEGANGHDRTKTNADTPLGTYDIPDENPWIDGGDRQAYGPNSRLNMVPESGEIIETGRNNIRIHGGRQEMFDSKTNTWHPIEQPTLKKTHGCVRAYDEDMKNFKIITEDLQQKNKDERPGKVFIIDDLKNENDKK